MTSGLGLANVAKVKRVWGVGVGIVYFISYKYQDQYLYTWSCLTVLSVVIIANPIMQKFISRYRRQNKELLPRWIDKRANPLLDQANGPELYHPPPQLIQPIQYTNNNIALPLSPPPPPIINYLESSHAITDNPVNHHSLSHKSSHMGSLNSNGNLYSESEDDWNFDLPIIKVHHIDSDVDRPVSRRLKEVPGVANKHVTKWKEAEDDAGNFNDIGPFNNDTFPILHNNNNSAIIRPATNTNRKLRMNTISLDNLSSPLNSSPYTPINKTNAQTFLLNNTPTTRGMSKSSSMTTSMVNITDKKLDLSKYIDKEDSIEEGFILPASNNWGGNLTLSKGGPQSHPSINCEPTTRRHHTNDHRYGSLYSCDQTVNGNLNTSRLEIDTIENVFSSIDKEDFYLYFSKDIIQHDSETATSNIRSAPITQSIGAKKQISKGDTHDYEDLAMGLSNNHELVIASRWDDINIPSTGLSQSMIKVHTKPLLSCSVKKDVLLRPGYPIPYFVPPSNYGTSLDEEEGLHDDLIIPKNTLLKLSSRFDQNTSSYDETDPFEGIDLTDLESNFPIFKDVATNKKKQDKNKEGLDCIPTSTPNQNNSRNINNNTILQPIHDFYIEDDQELLNEGSPTKLAARRRAETLARHHQKYTNRGGPQLIQHYQPNIPHNGNNITSSIPSNNANVNKSYKVGAMCYNPQSQMWEGNDDDSTLRPFDTGFKEKRVVPALIAKINNSDLPRVHAGVVFNPATMSWTAEVEDELIFSDDDSQDIDKELLSLGKLGIRDTSEHFHLSAQLKEHIITSQNTHYLTLNGWAATAKIRAKDKSFLFLARQLIRQ